MKLLYINVLFLMLVPSLFLMYLILTNQDIMEQALSKTALKKLKVNNSGLSKKSKNILLFLAFFLMTISLSRPVIIKKIDKYQLENIPLLIAIDISRSMNIKDIYPNRFEFAKKKSIQLINKSKNTNIGLVTFAKGSFIVAPLTYDFDSLIYLINNFTPNNQFKKGTDFMSLLHTANEVLKNYKTKNLLILTDGGNLNNYQKEINYAKKHNIKIYIIAIGSLQKNPIPISPNSNEFITDKNGKIVTITLNTNIQKLALQTGGKYIQYSIDTKDINFILNDIYKNSYKELFDINKNLQIYTELFYYPLAIAIIILLCVFSSFKLSKKSKNINLIIISIFLSTPSSSHAFIFDFITLQKAKTMYQNHHYKESISLYQTIHKTSKNSDEINYNLGNNYYKLKNYPQAIKYYKQVSPLEQSLYFKALHNLGNTYAYMHKYSLAIISYQKALKIHFDKQTQHNLNELLKHFNSKQHTQYINDKHKQNYPTKKPNNNKLISNIEENKWLEEMDTQIQSQKVMMYKINKSNSKIKDSW